MIRPMVSQIRTGKDSKHDLRAVNAGCVAERSRTVEKIQSAIDIVGGYGEH